MYLFFDIIYQLKYFNFLVWWEVFLNGVSENMNVNIKFKNIINNNEYNLKIW